MIRGLTTTIVSTCLAGAVGIGLFFIKHEVKEQEARLSELNDEIESSQEAIHVLKAEWSYLNDPARLRALAEKYLSMKVMGPTQVASLDSLPGIAPGPVYASRSNTGATVARADSPVHTETPARAEPKMAGQTKMAVAQPQPAKPAAPVKLAAIKAPAPKAAPAPVKVATVAKPVMPAATPAPVHVAAAPVMAPAPIPAPQQHRQAPSAAPTLRTSAPAAQPAGPGRTIVIQSPALASTPALPGEIR